MWQHQQRCYHTVQQQQLLPCSVTATAVATQCDGKNWSLQKNRKNDSNQPAVNEAWSHHCGRGKRQKHKSGGINNSCLCVETANLGQHEKIIVEISTRERGKHA